MKTHTLGQFVFDNFYTKNNIRFYRFAYSYVKDVAVAQDIVSESYLVLLNHLPNLPQNTNIEAYCLTIVKNKSLDHLRQREMHLRTMENMEDLALWDIQMSISSLEACNPSEIFTQEIETIISKTLSDLGERTAEVFRLSRIDKKTNKEIAEKLSITTKGVEFQISKALKLLRTRLKDYFL